jgi:FkbM family methyltransferase
MSFTGYVRRYAPPLWFLFKYHRYRLFKGEAEIHVLPEIVPPGRTAIDVGCSVGLYARALSHLAPKVIGFEANPAIAAFAKKVARRNVEIVNVALSADAAGAELRIPLSGRGRPIADLATIEASNRFAGETVTVNVRTRRLDDYDYSDCGFIKIDTEGHEQAVLEGAVTLLRTHRPVLMIELDENLNPGTIGRVRRMLERLGYEGYFRRRRFWQPIAEFAPERYQDLARALAEPRRRNIEYINNFVFVPAEAPPPAIARRGAG